jgi:two-component system phosphate regulon sensor histidine kinase PhoR
LVRSFTVRLAAATFLGLIPAGAVLFALAARGAVAPLWVVLTLALSLLTGGGAAALLARGRRQRDERLEAVTDALMRRQPPSDLITRRRDAPPDLLEGRLLDAADAVAAELAVLAGQREEFEAILRSMSEAVVVTGRRGDVVLLNGAAHRMFALVPEANYLARDFVELCRDPRLQEFVARATAADATELIAAELQIQLPAPRSLEVSAAPVRQNPSAAAWVFVFHDISRLKSYETMRSDFIANLTHELRTPLTALYGYAETLQKGVDDPATARRFLGIIARQSRRLARLIDDLVSLSDLERGFTPLKFEQVAPLRVIEEAVELMLEQARERGVALAVKPAAAEVELTADRDRLHQVLINLIDNAVKYTPRGGSVAVQAQAVEDIGVNVAGQAPLAGVAFSVADTGEGIPSAHIPRLTERFYRVDRARSRELGGTGLGLAIVKHIVQMHRGHLKIESRVREGTTVTVSLPLTPPPA